MLHDRIINSEAELQQNLRHQLIPLALLHYLPWNSQNRFLNFYVISSLILVRYNVYHFIYCIDRVEASLLAQMVKDPSAMQETWVWWLGQEDPLEKGMATHSRILAWEFHGQRSLAGSWSLSAYSPWSWKESDTTERYREFR